MSLYLRFTNFTSLTVPPPWLVTRYSSSLVGLSTLPFSSVG